MTPAPQLHASARSDGSAYASLGELYFDGRQVGDYLDILIDTDGCFLFPLVPVVQAGEGAAQRTGVYQWEIEVASLGVSLSIDLEQYRLQAGDKTVELQPGDLRLWQEALFVRPELVAERLGLAITFIDSSMILDVKTLRPWPRTLREAREMRWRRLRVVAAEGPQAEPLDKPYSLTGATLANVQLNYSASSEGTADYSYTVQGVTEALFLTNRFTLSGSQGKRLGSLRFETGRANPNGGVFGIDPLYEVRLGDVSGLSLPLAGGAGQGIGLSLRAAPLTEPDSFDVTLIEGDAQPGWDAELYIGGQIYDFMRVGDDGRYRFENVPLDFGTNSLKVVLYGPLGQHREIDNTQIVGSRLRPGEVNWWAHATRSGTKIYQPEDTADNDSGVYTGTFLADIGVTRNFKLGLSYGHLLRTAPADEGDTKEVDYQPRDYVGLKLQPTFRSFSLSGETTFQDDGAMAYALRGSLPLGRLTLSVGYEYFDENFLTSSAAGGTSMIKARTRLRGGLPVKIGGFDGGSLSLGWDRTDDYDGSRDEEYEWNYRHRLMALALSHRVSRHVAFDSGGKETARRDDYRGLYSYRHGLFEARGELNYDLYPGRGFVNAALSSSYQFHNRTIASCGMNYNASGTTSYSASLSRLFKAFSLSLSGSYTQGETRLGVNVEFGIGHAPGYGVVNDARLNLDGGMALLALDMDSAAGEDLPLDNVRATVNKRRIEERTDEKGQLLLMKLDTRNPTRLAVDPSTLPDPFLVTDAPEVVFWPREGQVIPVRLTLLDAVFVSGNLNLIEPRGGKMPVQRLRVQLLNADGLVVAETISLDDGFYQFETAHAGAWSVRLAPEQPGLRVPLTSKAVHFAVAPGELDVTGIDLTFGGDQQKTEAE
ncbi:MAG: hypothetical protein JXR59_02430 [Desulfuromonadaceae bacterium]|nr:hypothetical protein [Desulfuromonadaceae bacterium]